MIENINSDADFPTTLPPLALLLFGARWCGPCKALAPKIEATADTYPELHIFKIDVEECPSTVKTYGVRAIPTLVFLKNKTEVDRVSGNVPVEKIKALLDKHI